MTSYPIIPSRDVVSGRDGDALPPGPVPTTVRIPGKDALPASVAIATAVSQRQPLDLHRRTNIQMSLRRRCNRVYKSSGSITGINQPVFMYYSLQVCWNKTYKLLQAASVFLYLCSFYGRGAFYADFKPTWRVKASTKTQNEDFFTDDMTGRYLIIHKRLNSLVHPCSQIWVHILNLAEMSQTLIARNF